MKRSKFCHFVDIAENIKMASSVTAEAHKIPNQMRETQNATDPNKNAMLLT